MDTVNQKGFVSIRGLDIYTELHGSLSNGKPTIVVVPGGPGFGMHLYHKNDMFLEYANVLYYDPRGCGQSERPPSHDDYELTASIEELRELIENYHHHYPHLMNKVVLLGTSYGSIVAQGYACAYDGGPVPTLDLLVLVTGAASYRFNAEAKAFIHEKGNAQQQAVCEKYLWSEGFKSKSDLQAFFSAMMPLYSYRVAQGEHLDGYDDFPCQIDFLNYGWLNDFSQFDYTPYYSRVKAAKSLVLFGAQDWVCRPSQAKIIGQHLPHAEVHIIEKCAHSVINDQRQFYQNTIRKHLSALAT